MKKDLEKAINMLWCQWLIVNDPYKDDFENELIIHFPDHKFTWSPAQNYWILL